jgi:hypothetical protein
VSSSSTSKGNPVTKSNRDRVSEVMDALREGLGPFVLREYKQYHKGARYLQEIELMLKSGAYSVPHFPDEATALAKVDIPWLAQSHGAPVERCVQDTARQSGTLIRW